MFKVLIAEDDNNIRGLISLALKSKGYIVIEARNGGEALEKYESNHIDIILVDIMMPVVNGIELIKSIREYDKNLPLLIISAKDDAHAKRTGFIVGVDDYMVKPIDIEEMLLRVKALLRRAKIIHENEIKIGGVTVDYNEMSVKTEGGTINFPKKEFLLLYKLLSYPKKIFTRSQLMDEIWGYDAETDETTVNVHISRLRSTLKDVKEFEIVTVRGLGYKAVKNL